MYDRASENKTDINDRDEANLATDEDSSSHKQRAVGSGPVRVEGDGASGAMIPAVTSTPANPGAIVAEAVAELKRIEGDLSIVEAERQKKLSTFLACVYVASMIGKNDASFHHALVTDSGIPKRKNTPHHKKTLRAILKLAAVEVEKQTEHEYYLVIDGMDCANVPAQEEAVHEFLSGEEVIEEKRLSGFSRAKAARPKETRVRSVRTEAEKSQNVADQEVLYRSIIERVGQSRIGVIEAEQTEEVEDGVWLSVNRGSNMLLKLNVSVDDLRAIIVNHAATE